MERMHGIDAFSFYEATSTSPFTTLKVGIYRPVDPDDAPATAELRRFVKEQVLLLGGGRADQRVLRVPLDLHHPVWVTDPDYSPDDHIYVAALPAPGGKAELCTFLSDLMGRPLDPDRPLWEVWVLEGLEGGRVAVVAKVHHVLADGATVATLVAEGHQPHPDAAPSIRDVGEAVPGRARLLGGALVDLVRTFTEELPSFVRDLRRERRRRAAADEEAPPPTDAAAAPMPRHGPFTVLNRAGGGRYRVYRYESFPLADIKDLCTQFGCTVNTLVLGVCSEALRRYLAEEDAVPSEDLLAAVPVGDPGGIDHPTPLHPTASKNHVAVAFLPLHQGIDDFGDRLAAIKQSSDVAVGRVRRSWGRRFDSYLEFVPGSLIRLADALARWEQGRGEHAIGNVVISNVRGPATPLRALDGRLEMVELLSTGNITDLGHINITVWSYAGNLSFSFYLRKGALPAPDRIPALVREVVEELRRGRGEAPASAAHSVAGERAPLAGRG